MSKYDPLWEHVKNTNQDLLIMSYDEIEAVAGVPIDHSFLTYKKELLEYGFKVGKISMSKHSISFIKDN